MSPPRKFGSDQISASSRGLGQKRHSRHHPTVADGADRLGCDLGPRVVDNIWAVVCPCASCASWRPRLLSTEGGRARSDRHAIWIGLNAEEVITGGFDQATKQVLEASQRRARGSVLGRDANRNVDDDEDQRVPWPEICVEAWDGGLCKRKIGRSCGSHRQVQHSPRRRWI